MAAFFMAAPAAALGPPCGPRAEVVTRLKAEYGELSVGVGTSSPDLVVEVFVAATGSFSVVFSRANGIACIIAVGENWESKPLPVANPEKGKI